MPEFRQLFPLGKAYGAAFCNRSEETEQMLGNIKSGKHSLLIAPRRFGKSSLAEKVIEKSKLPALKINFHLANVEEEITQLILDATVKLIGIAIGKAEKLVVTLKKYLSNIEPSLSFGNDIAKLTLVPKPHVNHAVIIAEALLLIENLLREKNKHAVIFLDEFQEIARINKHTAVEGAIRTAAQEMQYLALIFSGSVRSLLLSMFEDESRPLYKLCRKIKLERIAASDYKKHLQKIALNTWDASLDETVFNRIMEVSNRHPYYVNYVCDVVWANCKNLPKLADIEKAWQQVIEEEWSDALKELADLPLGQRRLLKYIATHAPKTLHSHETSAALSMPISSIATAAQTMVEKDYMEQTDDGLYEIINPLLFAVLRGAED